MEQEDLARLERDLGSDSVHAGFSLTGRRGKRRWRGASFWLGVGVLLLVSPEAFADGFILRAQAYPIVYAPAFDSVTVGGVEAQNLTGAPYAYAFWDEGDVTLETNSYRFAVAHAIAGPPPSAGIVDTLPIDVVRGFAHANADSSYELMSLIAPYQGPGAQNIWSSDASAQSSISADIAVVAPPPLIPIELGFAYTTSFYASGPNTISGASVSGLFYLDDALLYSIDINETSCCGRTVYVNGLPASDFDAESFNYQPGKPATSYLSLSFALPPGRLRFDLIAHASVTNGLVAGESSSFGSASATIDPFLRVDPSWEYADLVEVVQTTSIDYDSNPLAGTPGEEFWAEYENVPEPDTNLLLACGVAGIAWACRSAARRDRLASQIA